MIVVGDGGPPKPGTLEYHLQQVADQYGRLTGKIVVQAATDPEHPLHNRLTWDDAVAGAKYRVHEARNLIRSVKVSVVTGTGRRTNVRAYVRTRDDQGSSYVPTRRVAESPIMREIVLAEMRADWRSFKERYLHYEEFFKMIADDLDAHVADPVEEVDGIPLDDPDQGPDDE